jgi:hypothetical protein
MKKVVVVLMFVSWTLLVFSYPAHAYLDPGSGSMLLQLLLGGVAGISVLARLYWRRFLAFLGIDTGEKICPEPEVLKADAEPETSVAQQ